MARDKRCLSFPIHKVGFMGMWSACPCAWFPPSDGELPGEAGPRLPPLPHAPPTASARPGLAYLVQGEGPHTERGQLDGVQQRDLDEAVGLRAPIGPVLIAFYLYQAGNGGERGPGPAGARGRRGPGLTRDFSSSRVIMTMVAERCSHTMRQKSPKVSGSGPCVAMYAFCRR